jgi:hypothetical protein
VRPEEAPAKTKKKKGLEKNIAADSRIGFLKKS